MVFCRTEKEIQIANNREWHESARLIVKGTIGIAALVYAPTTLISDLAGLLPGVPKLLLGGKVV
jgi:hypothetical protein